MNTRPISLFTRTSAPWLAAPATNRKRGGAPSAWLRAVAAFLIPIQFLTLQPALLWAAAAPDPAAPAVLAAPGTGLFAPHPPGPLPDLGTLQSEEAKLAVPLALANRTLPQGAGAYVTPALPENPTDAQLISCALLPEPLILNGETRPGENAALSKALRTFAHRTHREEWSALTDFLKGWPESAWRASISLQLGKMYLERGYTTRAVKVLKETAAALKGTQSAARERLQGQVAVQLARALVKAGRPTEAAPVVAAMAGRPQSGGVAEEMRQLAVMTSPRKKVPGSSGACGVTAVKSLYAALLPNAPMPLVLLSPAEQKRLKLVPGGDKGMSLKELAAFSRAAAMPLLPAKRKGGEWVIPSIIHWKSEHYSVLLKKSGNRYLVRDPLLGGDFWLSEAALADETTGFALIGSPALPKGWVAPSVSQLLDTRGRTGTPTVPPSPEPSNTCSRAAGGGGPKTGNDGCSSCATGMPNYKLYLAQASLGITDTPIAYQPAFGPALDFTLNYHERNLDQPIEGESAFVGRHWTMGGLSWVDDSQVEISFTSGSAYYENGGTHLGTRHDGYIGGKAKVFLPGGGSMEYQLQEWESEWWSPAIPEPPQIAGNHCPGPNDIVFEKDERGHSTLTRFGAMPYTGVVDVNAACGCAEDPAPGPLRYERRLSDGTIYRYGVWGAIGATFGSRAYLAAIVDPAGHATTFSYDSTPLGLRLTAITAADGVVMTFGYNEPGQWGLITDVAVAGRQAKLAYADGRLVAITDAAGMTSRFTYAPLGDFIVGMETPYGRTAFASGGDSDGNLWVEATQVVDGIPAKERVELHVSELTAAEDPQGAVPAMAPADEVPDGSKMTLRNGALHKRNTFYWDRKAMAEMGNPEPGAALDYGKARITHWMWSEARNVLYEIPSSVKAPLEGRVWYEYEGGADRFDEGTTNWQAKAIGRVVDGAGTLAERSQVRRFTYNDAGRVLASTDPLGRETHYGYNTQAMASANPGELLAGIAQKKAVGFDTLAQYAGHNPDGISGTADDALPSSTVDAAGQTTTYTYTPEGRVQRVTRTRNGAPEVTTYAYYGATGNGNAHRLHTIHGPGNVLLNTFTYDAAGRVFTSTGVDGYTVTNYYDALDRPVRTVFPDGTYEQTIYNKLDAEWQRDREGRWTHTEHNSQRQAVAVTDPLGRTTRFEWCPCGAMEAIIDAAGSRTTFIRDLQSRVVQKVYADTKATLYEYEAKSGRLAWMQDARGTTAAQKQRTNYEYYLDNALKRVSYTDANGVSLEQTRTDGTKINAPVDYAYDPFYNRITKMTDGTGETICGYHPVDAGDGVYGDGRLAAVDGPLANDTIAYSYDEYGRVKGREIDGVNNETIRTFDALGRIVSETNPLGTFGYGYIGNTGRLQRVSNGQGFATEYAYHPIVPAVAGTGDGDLRLSAIKHYKNALAATGTGTVDAQYDYHYTPGGNIRQWTQKWDNVTAGNDYKLAYDPADQLRGAENRDPITGTLRQNLGYGYDAAANRTLEQTSTPTSATASNVNLSRASYNNLNQLTSRTGGTGEMEVEGTVSKPANVTINGQPASALWKNQTENNYGFKGTANLSAGTNNVTVTATDAQNPPNTATKTIAATSSGTAIPALTYDDAGNMLTDGTRTYEWDAANRLITIIYAGTGNRTEFTYDGQGRRVREVEKTSGSTLITKVFVWQGSILAEERDDFNSVTVRFCAQGEARFAGVKLIYRYDHLGSIWETTSIAGMLHTRLNYDLWGTHAIIAGLVGNAPKLGYTGHYFHSRSGLHLAMYRAYSAEIGRWMSRDAKEEDDGPNLYGYVGNSTVGYVDPQGLFRISKPFHRDWTKARDRANTLSKRFTEKKYKALKDLTGCTKEQIDEALKGSQGPWLHGVGVGPSKFGWFDPDSPDSINFFTSFLDDYQNGKISDEFFDRVLEHELAHYLFQKCKKCKEPKDIEIGNSYEDLVYGDHKGGEQNP